ncbi:ATP-binding cassette domain-containing protein, partial [Methylobacterium sp. WL64]|uniref:ATP-binding cassette domain-containing protein n=1 Tax=Methylobacterium sp. WL64 TaxID=2603894 RepID=UPI001FEF5FA7
MSGKSSQSGMNARPIPAPTGAAILQVNDLTVHFPVPGRGGSRVHAVDGVSFVVRRGASFGIVGESGSGKSTTAQGIMRLVPATAGHVVLDGEDILGLRGARLRQARRHI